LNRKEENSYEFCPNYVQEFGLWANYFVCFQVWLLLYGGGRGDQCGHHNHRMGANTSHQFKQ
jgi:hypothetical protein